LPPMSKDHSVSVLAVGEILAGVVDDVVGAEGSYQVHLRGAAHTGDLGSEGLGDLDGWLAAVDAGAHSPGRPGRLTFWSTRPQSTASRRTAQHPA
jgi:hypothetical protein